MDNKLLTEEKKEPSKVTDGAGAAAGGGKKTRQKNEKAQKVFKKKRRFTVKTLVLLILIVALLAGGGYGVYTLFFYKEPVQVVTGTTKKDSITTMITGTATVQPTKFQNLTIPVAGTVNKVFVKQGDKVAVGDKLYTIDTTSLTQDIASMESSIASYQTQLTTYNKNVANLTITAPFSGKLLETTTALAGDTIGSGVKIATLVDDSKMKLALYFSNAYLDKIKTGMSAAISIPKYMSTLTGTVTGIDKVSYISAEGTVCFKVTISADNPGSLTKGLAATATIQSDGVTMSPADSGTFDYSQTKTITTQVGGTLSKLNVMDSLKVSSGSVLAVMTNDDYSNQITMLEKQIASAALKLQDLQSELSECSPTATVAGTVIFVRIEAGDTVTSGTSAMAVYNTDEVKIEASISETQNDYIKEGMTVTITKGTSTSAAASSSKQTTAPASPSASASASPASASPASASPASASPSASASASPASASPSSTKASNVITGTITKKSLQASSSNGVAYFPTTITIVSNGSLSPGIYVTYSITAAQASDVVLAPVAAIQQTTAGTCLFIKADTKPSNAVELGSGVVPDGYYAVKVETGLTNNDYVEIKSGISAGVTVFERYVKKNTTKGTDQTSKTSASPTTQQGQSQFQGPPGGFSGSVPGGR